MRELVNDRDRRNVQGVASVSLEGANASLTQNYIVVSTGHDVLGGQQQLFQSRSNAALEENRLLDLAQLAQQIEVLHIARAHLEDVNKRQHDRYLRVVHDLAD